METIPILYRIAEAYSHHSVSSMNNDNAVENINCFELRVATGKEVLLVDILECWRKSNPIGICFKFYARAGGDKMILLESPTCCVPVVNNSIFLVLQSCAYFPYAPAEHSISWFEKSQRDIYGSSSINIWDRYKSLQSKQSKPRQSSKQPKGATESMSSSKSGSRSKSNQGTKNKGNKDGDWSQTHYNTADAYFEYGEKSDSDVQPEQLHREHSDHFQDATRVLSDAAGSAAKSFFSFASHAMKSVASATAQGIESGSELASQGLAAISGSVVVGSHKVAIVKDLAEGGFGKVSLVKDAMAGSHYGKEYALKILLCQSRDQIEDAQNEIRMLQTFRGHPNIIQLIDHSTSQKGNCKICYMLFPVYTMGTAWDLIERHSREGGNGQWPFSELQCLDIMLGTVRALGAMHDMKCLHMDMKPHNILLTETMEGVVMDLGSAGHSDIHINSRRDALNLEDVASTKCSAPYRAPELYQVPQDFVTGGWVDIWSLGCTMHCMAFGWSPFENAREGVLKLAILNGRYSTPPGNFNCGVTFSQGYIDLIAAMLNVDYTSRPTAQDVKEQLKHLIDQIEGY